jgi:hypothetical protein
MNSGVGDDHDPAGAGREDAPEAMAALDQLADLQAGLLTAEEERMLRTRIRRDPQLARLWRSLEDTRQELAQLPQHPVPDDVLADLDAVIAAAVTDYHHSAPASDGEPATNRDPSRTDQPRTDQARDNQPRMNGPADQADIVDLDAARRRPRWRRLATSAALVAAAAAAVVIAVQVTRPQTPTPQPGSGPGTPVLTTADLPGQWPGVTAFHDLGFLAPPGKLLTCLASFVPAGATPVPVLGARPVILDGGYGELIAVPDQLDSSRVRLVVLGPGCAVDAQNHDVLGTVVVPR